MKCRLSREQFIQTLSDACSFEVTSLLETLWAHDAALRARLMEVARWRVSGRRLECNTVTTKQP
jgi:hypothetical protein